MTDGMQTERLDDLIEPPAATVLDAEASATAASADAPLASGPRTRWAGIVWGLVLAAVAAGGIWLASGEGRLDDLVRWTRDLSPATAIGFGVLAIGVLLLVAGLVGLLRRAQRAVARRRE
jgi:hypothetical protein